MVVARLGRGAEGVACTCPRIDEETAEVGLVACRGKQGAHLGQGTARHQCGVVGVAREDGFGTHIEAFEAALFVAGNEEFVSVAQGVAARVILEFVEARTDEAGAYLACLVPFEGTLIGELGAARDP